MTELQDLLVAAIKTFVVESPLNRLKDIDGSPMWQEPLVAFADGDDPLFALYKTVVGPFHLSPREAMSIVRSDSVPHVSIVSWILPAAEETKRSNREMTEGPSLRWNHSRFQGEEFNDCVRRYVVGLLEEKGYLAIAPVISPQFRTVGLANGPASTWSERHIAYAAGLGTFSLSDGLITAKGIAHRCGSAVFNAPCEPTPRPYTSHTEYCLHTKDGSCGDCIDRCPAGAISLAGHDKLKCSAYMNAALASWVKRPGYIGAYVACGLCQTGVPCESAIP